MARLTGRKVSIAGLFVHRPPGNPSVVAQNMRGESLDILATLCLTSSHAGHLASFLRGEDDEAFSTGCNSAGDGDDGLGREFWCVATFQRGNLEGSGKGRNDPRSNRYLLGLRNRVARGVQHWSGLRH